MQVHDIVVEVRDKTLKRVGMIPPEVLNLTAKRLLNNAGTWELSLPREHEMATPLATPGAGIIVSLVGSGVVLFSGPVTAIDHVGDADDPWGSISFQGQTDCVYLWDYLAWPQPSNSNPATQTKTEDTRTGKAETIMHQFVNLNMGPGGSTARKKANLTMGTNGARGPTLTKSARFTVLGDLLREIGAAGMIGFRVVQRGTGLVFETYALDDKSPFVRFDILNGSLEKHTVAITPPEVTRVIVQSRGDGDKDTYAAKTNTAATTAEADWVRRIEKVVSDGDSTDTTKQSKSDELLNDSGFTQVKVQAVASDDTIMRYGTDWEIGNYVAIVIDDVEEKALVTGFALKAGPDGTMLGAILGDPNEFDDVDKVSAEIKELDRRVTAVERGETATAGGTTEGWIDFTPNGPVAAGSGGCAYRVVNGICFVKAHIAYTGAWSGTFNIFTLPASARPSEDCWFTGMFFGPDSPTQIRVQANGQIINVVPNAGAGGQVWTASFPVGS